MLSALHSSDSLSFLTWLEVSVEGWGSMYLWKGGAKCICGRVELNVSVEEWGSIFFYQESSCNSGQA